MIYEIEFLIALAKTIVLETVGLFLFYYFWWKKSEIQPTIGEVLTAGLLTSALTLPYLWFVLPAFLLERTIYVWTGEIIVTLIEFLMLKRLLPITYGQAFLTAVAVNVFSVLVGIYLL